MSTLVSSFFFFFNDTATTEIYTLSLHDALPIFPLPVQSCRHPVQTLGSEDVAQDVAPAAEMTKSAVLSARRSEEHTSELQSRLHLVCRLLLEKKKKSGRDILEPDGDRTYLSGGI